MTILTARSPSHVRRCVEHSVDMLELEHLKKISVVCITDPSKLLEQGRLEEEEEDQGMFSQLPSSPSELSKIVKRFTSNLKVVQHTQFRHGPGMELFFIACIVNNVYLPSWLVCYSIITSLF